ncbi:hypothetical protein XELAEV_18034411mg [Xenopus laevis]|nr:hypothetical protein XELAEV_18034411mg [Xenopus laevis]
MSMGQLDRGHRSKYPAGSVSWRSNNKPVVRMNRNGMLFRSRGVSSQASVYPSLFELGDFSLHLENVGKQDSGRYQALAQYGDSKQECIVQLRIIHVTQSPLGVLPENSSVTLTCSGESSHPLRWLHGGNPVLPSNRFLKSQNTLTIQGLTQADRGKWSCELDGAKASVQLTVLGISGPAFLSLYRAVGAQAELPCTLNETPKEGLLSVQWHHNSMLLDQKTQGLTINPVNSEDAGIYRCDITYKGHVMRRHIQLKVIQVYPSGPSLVKEGSALQLLCNVSGSDNEETYVWTGPDPAGGRRYKQHGAVLNLPAVQTGDMGVWNCSVYGKQGLVGQLQYILYVHAAQVSVFAAFSSWPVYVTFLLIILLVLGLISAISWHNRRRRLLHLLARTTIDVPSGSSLKKVEV